MLDEEANLARLRAAGLDIPGIAYLERPVEAGGPIARFARLPLFGVANRINAYGTFLLMERESLQQK